MDNPAKALLIAAVILIVIILIAFGVRILNSSDGSRKNAENTGQTIAHLTGDVTSQLQSSFDKIGGSSPTGGSNGGGVLGGNTEPIVPNVGTYIAVSGETLSPGTPREPQKGDKYKYGDYEYMYEGEYNGVRWIYINRATNRVPNSWSVAIIDKNKELYGGIINGIVGKPVSNLTNTFANCVNMQMPPEIPTTVIYMQAAFLGCTSLECTPVIPANVTNINSAFSGCTSLKSATVIPANVKEMKTTFFNCRNLEGTIQIYANPDEYDNCLKNTKITSITGSCPDDKKQLLLATK